MPNRPTRGPRSAGEGALCLRVLRVQPCRPNVKAISWDVSTFPTPGK